MAYQKAPENGSPIRNDVEIIDGQKPIEEGLREIKNLLGDLSEEVLAEGQEITALSREDFQSVMFREAAYDYMQERYGGADRHLYILGYADGSQTFITAGKVSSGNPFEIGHAVIGGDDLRKTHVNVYRHYNGHWKMIMIKQNGIERESGDFGKPEELLPGTRQTLGKLVRIEHFTQPQK